MSSFDLAASRKHVLERLRRLGLERYVETVPAPAGSAWIGFRLRSEYARAWAPGADTLQLCRRLGFDTVGDRDDLHREILLALLLAPVAIEFPSAHELDSAVRIRGNIVAAARRTALAFDTEAIERPAEYWTYDEQRGFTLLPGAALIDALRAATQPDVTSRMYSFSCYRATEYVVLLALAQEVATCHPALFDALQRQNEIRAIKSTEFQDALLREYGSITEPLPLCYFVPGDRTWFRNPDEPSSDATGYEGSWVFYLGNGLFSNFWKREQPFTLTGKCVEIYHWRHGTYRDGAGQLQIDESRVEALVRASLDDPAETARILELMLRPRDPAGVYAEGGCIDTTRESPRWVCPGTTDVRLPDVRLITASEARVG